MNSVAIELLAPRYPIAWYPWAVQYFFLIALSYATLWLAAPALIFGKKDWLPTARLALLACLSATLVAPVALLADLHQPLRFWHFYAYANTHSWMSVGSVILPLYLFSVMGLTWMAWRPALQANRQAPGFLGFVSRWISLGTSPTPKILVVVVGVIALVFSTGIMLYTGAEVAIVKARPLWNTHWLPPMFVATGFITAAGLMLLLNRVTQMKNCAVNSQMLKVMLVATLAAAAIAAAWVLGGINDPQGSVAAAINSIRFSDSWRSTAIWGSITAVILFVGTLYMLFNTSKRPALHSWVWLLGLVAIHLGWMFRWVVLMDVQHVARNSAGFHHYGIPAGSSGLLGIVGTFGLWLAVMLLIDLFVPWRDAQQGGVATDIQPATNIDSAAKGATSHG